MKKIHISKQFLIYGCISVFVTLIDMVISRMAEFIMPLMFANTTGVVSGCLIQYMLTTQYVYQKRNKRVFIIFIVTFFIGLIIANGIVVFCRSVLFQKSESFWAFLISKGFSIVLPFFFNYWLRKTLVDKYGSKSLKEGKV